MAFALLSQSIVFLFFSCILDGGDALWLYTRSLLLFWTGVVWYSFRHRNPWTDRQLAVVRIGALPLTLLGMVVLGGLQHLWESLGIIRS